MSTSTALRGLLYLPCLLSLVSCSSQRGEELGRELPGAEREGGSADGGQSDANVEPDADAPLDADLERDAGEADASGSLDADVLDGAVADAGEPDAAAPDASIDCDAAVSGSRIQITFDPNQAERVTSVRWIDSAGVLQPNWAAAAGPTTCGDPSEFWGASYGAPEQTTPYPVVAGTRSAVDTCADERVITSAANDCSGAAQLPVTTAYRFYGGSQENQLRITRTFGFGADTPAYAARALHTYIPRILLAQLPTVIYPRQDSAAIVTVQAQSCANDCLIAVGASWNGQWFADVDAAGRALIVVRDRASTGTPMLSVNWDGYSVSNLTSFAIEQPAGGWKEPQTAVEYLCFADLASWPEAQRNAGLLPAGCGPN